MNEDGFLSYFLTGTAADGRKWRTIMNLKPEFISDGPLIAFLVSNVKDWDKDHDCNTVKFTFERPKLFPWHRDN